MILKRRLTKQRKIILSALKNSKTHLTADELYSDLKDENPELSLGTVYRNLNVLCEQGEIKKIEGDFSSSKYDGNISPHHHFYCDRCKSLYDVETQYSSVAVEALEKKTGHKVKGQSILYSGICKNCI